MRTLAISEQFFLLAMTPRGTMSIMNEYVNPCLLMASLLDLDDAGVIKIEKKKIQVVGEQVPEELAHLQEFYTKISQLRVNSLSKLATVSFEKELRRMTSTIREGMIEKGYIQTVSASSFLQKEKVEYQVEESISSEMIEELKSEMNKTQPSAKMLALAILLQKASLLNKYFSKQEQTELKHVLKQLRQSDISKQIRLIFDDIDAFFVILVTTILS